MALVIKSWKVTSNPKPGEPYVEIVGRKAGLLSWLLSLIGIDATVSMKVTARHMFFGTGSLAGFNRRIVLLPHISSTYYGLYKPWKMTAVFIAISFSLGVSLIGVGSRGSVIFGTLVLFGGVGAALLYYFLNKSLSIGFVEDSGYSGNLVFKRSVIEGQAIDENASEVVIQMIEHLVQPAMDASIAPVVIGAGARNICPKCKATVSPNDPFCGECGYRLKA